MEFLNLNWKSWSIKLKNKQMRQVEHVKNGYLVAKYEYFVESTSDQQFSFIRFFKLHPLDKSFFCRKDEVM